MSEVDPENLTIDPEFETVFRPHSDEEKQAFRINIEKDGYRDPLTCWFDGKEYLLLDGHHRLRHWKMYDEDDPDRRPAVIVLNLSDRAAAIEWIKRNQRGRRNVPVLDKLAAAMEQKPEIEAKARENQLAGKDLHSNLNEGEPVNTMEVLASLAGVSVGTLHNYLTVVESDEEDIKAELLAGNKSISGAAKEVKKRKKEQKSEFSPKPEYAPRTDGCSVSDLSQLQGRKFGVIYADPPWKYDNQATRASTDNHYPTLTIEDICKLPIGELAAENAQLHLWTTNAFLEAALTLLIPAWGFEFKSAFIWCKPQIGIGNYWRNAHEYLLTATRGSATFADKTLKSWEVYPRGEHSAKPPQVREMIEVASTGPYLELFAREARPGWTAWGNEISRQQFLETANV